MPEILFNAQCPPASLQLEATAFNRQQIQEQYDSLGNAAQIAFAGRSNVGKSSLINALGQRKQLAKTSSSPGKTRSVNFYRVIPDGFVLTDLPGYGYAQCSKEEQRRWSKLIEEYLESCSSLRGLALLLDCRLPPQASDRALAAFAQARRIRILPVLTKADKCRRREIDARMSEWSVLLGGQKPVPVSSKDGTGMLMLWKMLRNLASS